MKKNKNTKNSIVQYIIARIFHLCRASIVPYIISGIFNSCYAIIFELSFVIGYIVYIDKTRDHIPFLKGPDMVNYWYLLYIFLILIILNILMLWCFRIAKIRPLNFKTYWKITFGCAMFPWVLFVSYGIAYFLRFGTLF